MSIAVLTPSSAVMQHRHGMVHLIDDGRPSRCRRFAEAFAAKEKELHILVNNAGISWGAEFDKFPEKQVGAWGHADTAAPVKQRHATPVPPAPQQLRPPRVFLLQWDTVFAVNVKTIFNLTRALYPSLKAASKRDDPARVINIGSVAGVQHQPVPTYSYDASKAAVHALTRKLSSEFAPHVTCNAIAPGFVPSRMSKGLLSYAGEAVRRCVVYYRVRC